MPPNTVSVTRRGKHGNPYFPGCGIGYGFVTLEGELAQRDVSDPRVQVLWFRFKMRDMREHYPEEYEKYIAPLRGKNLACWCKVGDPCHGDVLLELACQEAA